MRRSLVVQLKKYEINGEGACLPRGALLLSVAVHIGILGGTWEHWEMGGPWPHARRGKARPPLGRANMRR